MCFSSEVGNRNSGTSAFDGSRSSLYGDAGFLMHAMDGPLPFGLPQTSPGSQVGARSLHDEPTG